MVIIMFDRFKGIPIAVYVLPCCSCSDSVDKYFTHIAGELDDEDEVLTWLTDEDTLEIPGRIEEVNTKMLEKILSENDHVVVFFCM